MTEQETIKIITLIVMSYPATERFKDENTIKGMVAVWKQMFQNDDAKIVELAVQKHISINKWVPSIAEIRETVAEIETPDLIPPDKAWEIFDKFRVGGNCAWRDKELPATMRFIVSSIGNLNDYYNDTEVYRRFMELYKPAYERAKKQAQLPTSVRNGILSIHTDREKLLIKGACET